MLVAMSSVKGAPGVSSWALLLSTAWPNHRDRVLVEADGSGGVFGSRYDIATDPGAAALVSAARRGSFSNDLQLQTMARLIREPSEEAAGLWVVPGPLTSYEALAAWRALAKPAATAMNRDGRLWVADCGRVWAGAPAEILITSAALNIVVSDDSVPSLVSLPSRVQSIPGRVALIVVGKAKHTSNELIEFAGADYVWKVPHIDGLAAIAGEIATTTSRARRNKVWQTALEIAHQLASDFDIPQSAPREEEAG